MHQDGGEERSHHESQASDQDQGGARGDDLPRCEVVVGVRAAERVQRHRHAAEQRGRAEEHRVRIDAARARPDRGAGRDPGHRHHDFARSKRSDSQPIGHCSTSPPNRATAMKSAVRSTASPISVPYTGPMEYSALWATPIRRAPATPSGDARNRARTPMDSGASNAGARPTLSVIGIRAKETRTETSTKSSKPRGSDRFNRSWRCPYPQHHDHVHRQELTAGPVRRRVVDPALRHHVQAGEAESGDYPNHEPGDRRHEHRVQQGRPGRERGEGGEHANVSDVGEQPRHDDGAGEESGEVPGHHQPRGAGAEPLQGGPHSEQRALQTVAEHDEGDAEEQAQALEIAASMAGG